MMIRCYYRDDDYDDDDDLVCWMFVEWMCMLLSLGIMFIRRKLDVADTHTVIDKIKFRISFNTVFWIVK